MSLNNASILLVEDDERLAWLIRDNLVHQGWHVIHATEGTGGLELLKKELFDLVLLDVMLPGADGFTVARRLREFNATIPVLFITARGDADDRLEGFRAGGDDYIVKPFSIEELIYRIRVFLKRRDTGRNLQDKIETGTVSFDPENRILVTGNNSQILTARESALLEYLMRRPNRIIKREEVLKAVWEDDHYLNSRSLDVYISKLRKYLKASKEIQIRSIHGVGFILQMPDNK
ncbi:MAG: response regulator transcription factor [Bacteroidales bacterium]